VDTPEEPAFLETLYRDLALALGDAVWAFARLEWLTYKMIRSLSDDRVDELIGDLNFRGRISILRRLIDRRVKDEGRGSAIRNLLKEAERLSEKRNVIVHNPWEIWIDLDAEEFMTEIQRYSDRTKKVDLGQLRDFTKSAGDLENRLKEALREL
jgi:hypothetical protein